MATIKGRQYGLGVIEARERKGGTVYRVRAPDGRGGRHTIGTFATREEAEQMRAAAYATRDELGIGTSLRAYYERWLSKIAHQANIRSWRSVWNTTIGQAPFADWPLDSITRANVRDWLRTLPAHVSPQTGRPISWSTQRHALSRLKLCFDEAVDDGLIQVNPAAGHKLKERRQTEGWTYLTWLEIVQLLMCDELPLEQRVVFALGIYGGLRQGELAAMRWEHVDLEDLRQITVAESWGSSTKGGKPRTVPLLSEAYDALKAWSDERGNPSKGWVFTSQRGGGRYARGYDWGWSNHAQHDRTRLGWRWVAGIRDGVRFHDLRHTCASHLVMGTFGRVWSIYEVSAFLGHSEIKVTQRYARLSPDHLRRAVSETYRPHNHPQDFQPNAASGGNDLASSARVEPATFGFGGQRHTNDSAGLDPAGGVVGAFKRKREVH